MTVQSGIAAADPDLLPVGSVIQVDSLGDRYNGIYTIMDTGPAVQGRQVDIYMWSCNEALAFGRRDASHDRAAPRLEPARHDAEAVNRPLLSRAQAQHRALVAAGRCQGHYATQRANPKGRLKAEPEVRS